MASHKYFRAQYQAPAQDIQNSALAAPSEYTSDGVTPRRGGGNDPLDTEQDSLSDG